jgi:hypothetical protein
VTSGPKSDPQALRAAWETAARDLGIEVSTEDCWLVDDEGRRHALVAIVHDFGGSRGMAIFEQTDQRLNDLAAIRGFGYTWLSRSYETYARDVFEDTLNDWQWTGEGAPPAWYTSEPWTEVE